MDLSILYLLTGFCAISCCLHFLKKLPTETLLSEPFQGLKINLRGAFGGYFLLLLIAFALGSKLLNDNSLMRIQRLNA